MRQFSREVARRVLEDARAAHNPSTSGLSEQTFLDQFGSVPPPWAVGSFRRRPELDFRLEGQWPDPLDIGWTSESIINPSVIVRGDELHLFYRASPKKESLSSRIGHAIYAAATGWRDVGHPVVFPDRDNEALGVEDPKVYAVGDGYALFYNGIFEIDEADRARHPSPGYPVEGVGCDINLALSDDLRTWRPIGPVIGHDVSRLWAKGAVIPRDREGRAVRIGGEYLMYLSEGCDGVPVVGRSDDLVTWRFAPQPYLDLGPLGGHLHEVATALVLDGRLVLDFFYSADETWSAGQALYALDAPFTQLDISPGGTLAWGGMVEWSGELVFAQGWDAPPGSRELQFYSRPL
jgi:beta-1,2-mannosidase